MAYDPTIPVQTNQVRGASGDLVKIKENFAILDPVATSGLHGLISGGESVASGQIVITQGGAGSDLYYRSFTLPNLNGVTIAAPASGQALTWNGSAWVNATPVSTLSGLSDTVIDAPISGEALTWNGSAWVNDTPVTALSGLSDTSVDGAISGEALIFDGSDWVASGSVSRARASAKKTVDQTGIATGSWVTVTGFEDVLVGASYGAAASGMTISGDGFVDVQANIDFASSTGAQIGTRLTLNGAPLSSGAYGVEAELNTRDGGGTPFPVHHLVALGVPVTSGDVVGIQVNFSAGATTSVLSGVKTNIRLQDNAQAPGGGGGGSSSSPKTIIAMMTSGGTFSISGSVATICSGVTIAKRNDGGFTLISGAITVPATSGYTHVRITGNVGYATNATGYREATIWHNGAAGIQDPLDPAIVIGSYSNRSAANPTGGAISVMQVVTPLIPISGGDVFALVAGQGSGGPLDTIGGAAVQGAITSITIEAYTLT